MRDLIRDFIGLASLVAFIWAVAFAAIALNPPPLPV